MPRLTRDIAGTSPFASLALIGWGGSVLHRRPGVTPA